MPRPLTEERKRFNFQLIEQSVEPSPEEIQFIKRLAKEYGIPASQILATMSPGAAFEKSKMLSEIIEKLIGQLKRR